MNTDKPIFDNGFENLRKVKTNYDVSIRHKNTTGDRHLTVAPLQLLYMLSTYLCLYIWLIHKRCLQRYSEEDPSIWSGREHLFIGTDRKNCYRLLGYNIG